MTDIREKAHFGFIHLMLLDYLHLTLLLAKVADVLTFHFQEEENLQKKVSYPELAAHHAKHEEFKKSIQELYDYLNENEGPDDQFIEQVKRNVVDWLFQHIKTFDRSVAEYIHLKDNSNRL